MTGTTSDLHGLESQLLGAQIAADRLRRLSIDRPADHATSLVRALSRLQGALLKLDRVAQAEQVNSELLEACERFGVEQPQMPVEFPSLSRPARRPALGPEPPGVGLVDGKLSLTSSRWAQLSTCSRDDGTWLADALWAFGSTDAWLRDGEDLPDGVPTWQEVHEAVLHQQSVYPATAAALPHLVDLLASRQSSSGRDGEERVFAERWIDLAFVVAAIEGPLPADLVPGMTAALPIAERAALECLRTVQPDDVGYLAFACLALAGHDVGALLWRFVPDEPEEFELRCPQCGEYADVSIAELPRPSAPPAPEVVTANGNPWTALSEHLAPVSRSGSKPDPLEPFREVAATATAAGLSPDTSAEAALCVVIALVAVHGKPGLAKYLTRLLAKISCSDCGTSSSAVRRMCSDT